MTPEQLRDIIATARLDMLVTAGEYRRAGAEAQAQGIEAAIEILDKHIQRVYKDRPSARGDMD